MTGVHQTIANCYTYFKWCMNTSENLRFNRFFVNLRQCQNLYDIRQQRDCFGVA